MYEMTIFAERSTDDAMTFTQHASSEGRGWQGIQASIYDFSAGISVRPPSETFRLLLHLSDVDDAECRCDGISIRREIHAGDLDFVALGSAASWHDRRAGRVASINIEPFFMHEVAARNGSSRTPIFSSRLGLRDPVLAHLALALVHEVEAETGEKEPEQNV